MTNPAGSVVSVLPEHDCPACPSCKTTCGTPAREASEPGRWDGPGDATLWCPACGTAWAGEAADVEQAERAWKAWEESERR